MSVKSVDYENLTDDELMLMEAPSGPDVNPEPEEIEEQPTEAAASVSQEDLTTEPASSEVTAVTASEEETSSESAQESGEAPAPAEDASQASPDPSVPSSEADEGSDAAKDATPASVEAGQEEIDYKAAYEAIMAPFKANGREMRVHNPDEVIRLMQQGANYTQKMQGLAPNLKLMRMLQNNGLLDADKLNRLIDLDQRKPEAIQQLLKDAQIDPLDLDLEEAPVYTPGNHTVSDAEHQFQSALEDALSTPAGRDTVTDINQKWDQASKDVLFEQPQLLSIIQEQRDSGIYNRISDEVDRQKMLGQIPQSMPFLQAYKQVGDVLQANGQLGPKPAPQAAPAPAIDPTQVLETRPASSHAPQQTSPQVRAAAAPRSAPKPAKVPFNPIDMTDEEIERMTAPPR